MRTASAKASQVAKSERMIFSFRPTLLKWRVNEPLLDLVRLRRGVIARTGKLQSKQPDVTGHKIIERGFCESKNRLIQAIQLLVTLRASIRNRCQFIYRPDTQKVSRHNPSAQPRSPAALRNPDSFHHRNLYAHAARPAIHFLTSLMHVFAPAAKAAGGGLFEKPRRCIWQMTTAKSKLFKRESVISPAWNHVKFLRRMFFK